MEFIEGVIRRLSLSQLRALHLLAKKGGILSSSASIKAVGKEGKALGGVFSSLSRKNVLGQHFVMPWGRDLSGHGLRWKLNEKLITREHLLKVTGELLS